MIEARRMSRQPFQYSFPQILATIGTGTVERRVSNIRMIARANAIVLIEQLRQRRIFPHEQVNKQMGCFSRRCLSRPQEFEIRVGNLDSSEYRQMLCDDDGQPNSQPVHVLMVPEKLANLGSIEDCSKAKELLIDFIWAAMATRYRGKYENRYGGNQIKEWEGVIDDPEIDIVKLLRLVGGGRPLSGPKENLENENKAQLVLGLRSLGVSSSGS